MTWRAPPQPQSLANLRPFQPGQSGNPGGRKKLRGVASRVKEILEKDSQVAEAVAVLQDAGEDVNTYELEPLTYGDLIAMRLIQLAVRGRMEAIALVMAYSDGKPGDKALQEGQESRPRLTVEDFQRAMGLRRETPPDSPQNPPETPPGAPESPNPAPERPVQGREASTLNSESPGREKLPDSSPGANNEPERPGNPPGSPPGSSPSTVRAISPADVLPVQDDDGYPDEPEPQS